MLGAGVAGLVAADRLARAGLSVDVYERWPGLGGQAATLDVGGGHRLERYYHHWFTSDTHAVALCEELGLQDEVEWHDSSVAFLLDGALHPFTTPLDLLRFRPLPPLSRLRVGLGVVRLQRAARGAETDLTPYEHQTARAWIEEHLGRAAWAGLWGPLLRSKFGTRAEEIAMVWLHGKLVQRRQVKGKEARQELLGYPRNSFEPLYAALQDRITEHGGRVLIDRPAARLQHQGGWIVTPGVPGSFRHGHDPSRFDTLEPERYDRVLATVPSDVFDTLTCDLPLHDGYRAKLRSIDYHAALCLLLELDRPFGRFYWTNVADPELPFLGLIEHTNLVGAERYDGRRFLYVANYLAPGDPLLELDIEALLEHYEPGLKRANPAFERDWVGNAWLFREPAAQPIVDVGYRERIPPLETGLPGLTLANTTQVYPEDRGTSYAVRLGEQAVQTMLRPTARHGAGGSR